MAKVPHHPHDRTSHPLPNDEDPPMYESPRITPVASVIALTRTDLSKRRSGTDFWSSAPGGTRFGALTPVQASSLGS